MNEQFNFFGFEEFTFDNIEFNQNNSPGLNRNNINNNNMNNNNNNNNNMNNMPNNFQNNQNFNLQQNFQNNQQNMFNNNQQNQEIKFNPNGFQTNPNNNQNNNMFQNVEIKIENPNDSPFNSLSDEVSDEWGSMDNQDSTPIQEISVPFGALQIVMDQKTIIESISLCSQKIQHLLKNGMEFFEKELKAILQVQQNLKFPIRDEKAMQFCQNLLNAQNNLKNQLDTCINEIDTILRSVILTSPLLITAEKLEKEFRVFLEQLNLWKYELQQFMNPKTNPETIPCIAKFVILQQPYPKPTKQGTIEELTKIRLLCGAQTGIRPSGNATATMVYENQQKKKSQTTTIQNNSAQMRNDGIVEFKEMQFPSGTRLKVVRLKFSVSIDYKQANQVKKAEVESGLTEPFIIITNENQYGECYGHLLRMFIFKSTNEVPWQYIANKIQIVYLHATRQSLMNPTRPLSFSDFMYMHLKLRNKANVTSEDFNIFWIWLGKFLQNIRHQKPINNLWMGGYIIGFITKGSAIKLLQGQEEGTFIVRFSERVPGQFAVAYVKKGNVKHYLVTKDDIAPPARSLAHFIAGKKVLTTVVRVISPDLNSMSQPKIEFVPKMQAFGEWMTSPSTPVPGYDQDL
eukprot:TRINITY_DN787_c0_g1_i1.p1 TRINITY_DN787_c0_g1~~TRINITY_DN787_c0_g1_i1.p1  ORF type:complete len:636 (-),score=143.41 TRINITY_DN787_c0_g1_i1:88-1968(-)